jgi:hypothetical protein
MTKPGDLLLGVLDFFAILLPGSMATWLVTRYAAVRQVAVGFGTADSNAIAFWGAFLLSSYVLGHFVFMAGSRLDGSYDRWRRRARTSSRDAIFQAAAAIQKQISRSLADGGFTTLKWAKAFIQIHAPHARAEIDRLEADSKFFRSLVVVAIAMTLHFLLVERSPAIGLASAVLGLMAFWRYCDQRWKMSELSYATAVILHKGMVDGALAKGGGGTSACGSDE